jgi:excisionase family DNA binding protein
MPYLYPPTQIRPFRVASTIAYDTLDIYIGYHTKLPMLKRRNIHIRKGKNLKGNIHSDFSLSTTEEVAKYFGKSPAWVRTAISVLAIPHYKLGNQYRFKIQEIEEWLNKQ